MQFRRLELENGSNLFHMYLPNSLTVASGVLVRAGTVDEHWPEEAGLAHASEHMRFQGTTNPEFPDSKAIAAYTEDVGGMVNAWTSQEGTFFYQILPASEFARSPHLLANLLLSPAFPEDKISTEMNNIVQEIKRANDDPRVFLNDSFTQILYSGNPLSKRILGTEEAVKSFTRKHFLDYAQRLYNNNNFTFFVVGNVKAENAAVIFNKEFGAGIYGETNDRAVFFSPQCLVKEIIFPKEIEQVHLQIGSYPSVMTDTEIRALQVFSWMIGGGMSFPLFQIVRDKNGLCYQIGASFERSGNNLCHFQIYVGTDPQKYPKAVELIYQVIEKCKNDEQLLQRAKTRLLGCLALSYEQAASIMSTAVGDVLNIGRPRSQKDRTEAVKSVTIEDVAKAVESCLVPSKTIIVMLKPKQFCS